MKKFIILFLFLVAIVSSAQIRQQEPCGFDEYNKNRGFLEANQIIQNGVERFKNSQSLQSEDDIKIIPVVIHVLHIDGPENISDEQIESQIRIMNEDFGKLPNTPGDGAGVDTKVRYCLAKIDPNGNCTNGIVRVYTSLTNHKSSERAELKKLSFWDNKKYMNIYLVKSINGGTLGYSSFPTGPDDEDGMVVLSRVFGDVGTAEGSFGRTASHEIGHWFGLYHTFQNGCGTDLCTDGDFVCDTPPQAEASYTCETKNTCDNDNPDLEDQKENYMNYTPGSCKSMFTNGQKLRMHSTLENIRTNIWSESNLIATGCNEDYIAPDICSVGASFVTLTPDICIGNSVNFLDISLNDATTWLWTFEGGTPLTSTDENPIITYEELGTYSVKLVVSNGESIDSITVENFITVSEPGVGDVLPLVEDFDSGMFPTANFTINNYDGNDTWELDSAASVSGKYSIKINNLSNTFFGSADEIEFPYLDLTTNPEIFPTMTFKWAYARSVALFSDQMIVLLSTDCGANFKQVYFQTKDGLATGPTQKTPFVPNPNQWKKATIPLIQYYDQKYVKIKIVNITDGGNNLYIDDIQIGDIPLGIDDLDKQMKKEEQISFYPNPATDNIKLNFSENIGRKIIKIYNSLGEELFVKEIYNKREMIINTDKFTPGLYYIETVGFNNGNRNSSFKKLIISD